MTIIESLIQPSFVCILCLCAASIAFWAPNKKLVPADGMDVLHETHNMVESGNLQTNNRLARLEKRMDGIETKLDMLIKLNMQG